MCPVSIIGCVVVLLLAAATEKTITNAASTTPTATYAAGIPHKLLPTPTPTPEPVTTSPADSLSAVAFNLTWTTRTMWQAAPARRITPINENMSPVSYVIVHHTATSACQSTQDCHAKVRAIQRTHQLGYKWDDIGYNFLIGGGEGVQPAEIYEGRGFNVSGSHASPYNQRSLGVALIGDWSVASPPPSMLEKLQQLITYGEQMGYVKRNYALLGHRQLKNTECPGTQLFNEIKQWPHYRSTAQ